MRSLLVMSMLAGCIRTDLFATEPATTGARPIYYPTPPGTAFGYRAAQYNALRTRTIDRDVVSKSLNHGTRYSPYYLVQANGQKVEQPVDLLPLVEPDSEFARLVRARKRAYEKAHNATWVLVGGAGLGGTLLTVGIIGAKDHGGLAAIPITLGAIGFAAGLSYGIYGISHYGDLAAKHHKSALERFDASFAAALRVCTSGINLIDCDRTAVAPPPVAPPTVPVEPAAAEPATQP